LWVGYLIGYSTVSSRKKRVIEKLFMPGEGMLCCIVVSVVDRVVLIPPYR
jgi:hypothetical protein